MKRSTPIPDPFSARTTLSVGDRDYTYYRLDKSGLADLGRAPMTVKVLMENVLRNAARGVVRDGSGERMIDVLCRLDGPVELDYYRQGGILPAVLRRLAAA